MSNNKKMFLDADSSIIEKNLRFVKNELEDEFNNIFEPSKMESTTQQAKQRDYIITKPVPGFCIKTHSTYDNRKYFINVCQTSDIPAPQNISEEELHVLIISETPSSFKIPMSISELRQINDRSGLMATACDIAINPNFFEKVQNVSLFRNFLLTIVFEAIEDKYGVEIDIANWTVLKNRKSMGGLISHRIQNRDINKVINTQNKMPNEKKVQEVGSAAATLGGSKQKKMVEEIDEITYNDNVQNKNTTNIKKSQEISLNVKKPQYNLMKENLPDNKVRLIAEFHLPECISANEITLDVGEDRILLEARKRGYLFDAFVDYVIDQKNITAEFVTLAGVRTILY